LNPTTESDHDSDSVDHDGRHNIGLMMKTADDVTNNIHMVLDASETSTAKMNDFVNLHPNKCVNFGKFPQKPTNDNKRLTSDHMHVIESTRNETDKNEADMTKDNESFNSNLENSKLSPQNTGLDSLTDSVKVVSDYCPMRLETIEDAWRNLFKDTGMFMHRFSKLRASGRFGIRMNIFSGLSYI